MDMLATKSLVHPVEIKSEGPDGSSLHIKAYACAFGNVDSWGDIIVPTALDAFLKSEEANRVKLCYQHQTKDVIGVITSMTADNYGLAFEADIIDTTIGLDVQKLIKAGAIDEFSIQYRPDSYHDGQIDGEYVRYLDAVTIVEISPVTRAANPKAVLLDAKAEDVESGLRAMSDEEFSRLRREVNVEYARRVIAKI